MPRASTTMTRSARTYLCSTRIGNTVCRATRPRRTKLTPTDHHSPTLRITAGDAQESFVSPGWMRARGLAGENRSFGRITSQISCLQCLLHPPEWLIQWQSMLPPACINPCSSVALTPSFAFMLRCSRSAATAMRPPRKTLSPRSRVARRSLASRCLG